MSDVDLLYDEYIYNKKKYSKKRKMFVFYNRDIHHTLKIYTNKSGRQVAKMVYNKYSHYYDNDKKAIYVGKAAGCHPEKSKFLYQKRIRRKLKNKNNFENLDIKLLSNTFKSKLIHEYDWEVYAI